MNNAAIEKEWSVAVPEISPWVGFNPRPEILWLTVSDYVTRVEKPIIFGARSVMNSGIMGSEDIKAEAILVAFDSLNTCIKKGRIDQFNKEFFFNWKYHVKDIYRKQKPFANRIAREGLEDSILEKMQSPEAYTEEVVTHKDLQKAFCFMTDRQVQFWKNSLAGAEMKMTPQGKNSIIRRSLKRVRDGILRTACMIVVCCLSFAGQITTAHAETIEESNYTFVDPSTTVSFVQNQKMFVIGEFNIEETPSAPKVKNSYSQKFEVFKGGKPTPQQIIQILNGQKFESRAKPLTKLAIKNGPTEAGVIKIKEGSHKARTTQAENENVCRLVPILFPFNSSTFSGLEKSKITAALKRCHGDYLSITGHTCDIGSRAFNKKLSNDRAQVVANYLKDEGFVVVEQTGVGFSYPFTRDPAKKYLNRRVEILTGGRGKK